MRSRVGRSIIENQDWKHNQMVDTKDLAGYIDGIGLETFCQLFQLNAIEKSRIKNQKGKVRIKIYDKEELEEIEKEIQKEYRNGHIDIMHFKRLEKRYRLTQTDLKKMYLLSNQEYKKLELDPFALVENHILKRLSKKEKEKEIQENYQKQSYLTRKELKILKKKVKLNDRQIARIFHIAIEQVRNLEKGQASRIRINLMTCKKGEEIKKEFLQELLAKRTCNKEELEELLERSGYHVEILRNILGISSLAMYQLENGIAKVIPVCDRRKQVKVHQFIIDLESYAKPEKEDYRKKELERKLKDYDLTLQDFLEYSDKKRRIRAMYQEAMEKQGKITWKKDIQLDSKFLNKNLGEIQEKVTLMVKHFCNVYHCFQEQDDYIQTSYAHMIEKGGYIQKNTKYDTTRAINRLVLSAKRHLLEEYYKAPIVYSLTGYRVERKEDTNIALKDNTYQPEECLLQEPEEIHGHIFEEIEKNLFAIEDDKERYERLLAYQYHLDYQQYQTIKRQLGELLLYNEFVKQDKYGRIIQVRPLHEEV